MLLEIVWIVMGFCLHFSPGIVMFTHGSWAYIYRGVGGIYRVCLIWCFVLQGQGSRCDFSVKTVIFLDMYGKYFL